MKNMIHNTENDFASIKAEYDRLGAQIHELHDIYINLTSKVLDLERDTEIGVVSGTIKGFGDLRSDVHRFASWYTAKEKNEKLAEIAKKESAYKDEIEQKRKKLKEYKIQMEKVGSDRESLIDKESALYRRLEELKRK